MSNNSRVRIKMCGMTREQDVNYAIQLGVDAIGLIFARQSSRCIDIETAKSLLLRLPPFVSAVAVLVNPEVNDVNNIIENLPIDMLQFHGEESSEFCEQFNKPFIKAIPANSSEFILNACSLYKNSSALLLDTPHPELYGGSGKLFDWKIIPKNTSLPIIIAGGLNSENIAISVKTYRPYAIDLCSGIEFAKGIKDFNKMQQFMSKISEL